MRQNARIFVIQDDDGAIKVGHSTDPNRRVHQLERASLKIVHVSDVYVEAERVERAAHRLLAWAGKRISPKGDWFSASLEEAIAAINKAALIADGLEPMPPPAPSVRTKAPTERILIRFPRHILDAVQEIVVERGNVTERATIIRELVAEALAVRSKRK